uniref:C2H2-type domain-containing protein n=1 Tax=Panagrellus redivivus TaxID=6233 RepID=A0A7E4UV18_PANRE
MDPDDFTYITEDDDRFVMNHFERNETGKFECQHFELVFDNVDSSIMAKHLRRKHPLDTKTRRSERS